jgi:hypothetical protein
MPSFYSVASVPNDLSGRGLPLAEQRQRARWGSGGWYQVWLGRGFRFLPPQVRQDSIDGLLLLDTCESLPHERSECFGYDPDRPTAAAANLDVDAEHMFQALSPCHRHMNLGG